MWGPAPLAQKQGPRLTLHRHGAAQDKQGEHAEEGAEDLEDADGGHAAQRGWRCRKGAVMVAGR